jgi:hypothetical protein
MLKTGQNMTLIFLSDENEKASVLRKKRGMPLVMGTKISRKHGA